MRSMILNCHVDCQQSYEDRFCGGLGRMRWCVCVVPSQCTRHAEEADGEQEETFSNPTLHFWVSSGCVFNVWIRGLRGRGPVS